MQIGLGSNFRNHIIGKTPYSMFDKMFLEPDNRNPDGHIHIYSEIPGLIFEIKGFVEYSQNRAIANNTETETSLKWIGIFLLPVGLAVRATKTSIEIVAARRPPFNRTIGEALSAQNQV